MRDLSQLTYLLRIKVAQQIAAVLKEKQCSQIDCSLQHLLQTKHQLSRGLPLSKVIKTIFWTISSRMTLRKGLRIGRDTQWEPPQLAPCPPTTFSSVLESNQLTTIQGTVPARIYFSHPMKSKW